MTDETINAITRHAKNGADLQIIFVELKILQTPILDVKFSDDKNVDTGVKNRLYKDYCLTLGHLVRYTEADLVDIRAFGKIFLKAVKDTLEGLGLELSSPIQSNEPSFPEP